jgi:polyisoprenoid-binding protein YceI
MRNFALVAAASLAFAGVAHAQAPKPPAATTAAQPASTAAPTGDYVVDLTHASLQWKMMHQGLAPYVARFTIFDAQLSFNEADVAKSKLSVTIDPNSVETDYARTRPATSTTDFNKEVATDARFLNSLKFPKITYVSKSISKTGDKAGRMTGDLTFLGVTKPVTLDVTYVGNRNDPRSQKHKLGFSAAGKFKRSDFGMPVNPALGDEITLEIHAEFVQK